MMPIQADSATEVPKPALEVHEWLAVMSIIALLGILTAISLYSRFTYQDIPQGIPHHLTPPVIEVLVQGAVENPGNYSVPPGTLVVDILNKAKPLPDADLRRFKSSSKARNGQVIKVPSRPVIALEVAGAVLNPGPVTVPKGTKLSELSNFVQFSPDVDISKLQKRRRLKDGEHLTVPKLN